MVARCAGRDRGGWPRARHEGGDHAGAGSGMPRAQDCWQACVTDRGARRSVCVADADDLRDYVAEKTGGTLMWGGRARLGVARWRCAPRNMVAAARAGQLILLGVPLFGARHRIPLPRDDYGAHFRRFWCRTHLGYGPGLSAGTSSRLAAKEWPNWSGNGALLAILSAAALTLLRSPRAAGRTRGSSAPLVADAQARLF